MRNEPTGIPNRRQLHIFGGATREAGTIGALSEGIARRVAELTHVFMPSVDTNLHLVNPIEESDGIRSDADLVKTATEVTERFDTKLVFWFPESQEFQTAAGIFRRDAIADMAPRKDIYLVTMTTTHGATGQQQYLKGLDLIKHVGANLNLAYDTETGNGMIVAPEESVYHESSDLDFVLRNLLDIANKRSQLTFTRSTVIGGDPVPWDSSDIYSSLRHVVDFCIERGAYKPFLGVTAGHFAAKIASNQFLTSMRKTNFINLPTTGLVKITTDGPDRVVAMGGRPSVGGQSQRIVFADHPERDSIVHFHCPLLPGSNVPVVPQRDYECGSHECGQNTSNGLALVEDGIEAVFLKNHGPNIVFHHDEDPTKIEDFILDNFDLDRKSGGYQLEREIGLVS